jgi:hypothetical protein
MRAEAIGDSAAAAQTRLEQAIRYYASAAAVLDEHAINSSLHNSSSIGSTAAKQQRSRRRLDPRSASRSGSAYESSGCTAVSAAVSTVLAVAVLLLNRKHLHRRRLQSCQRGQVLLLLR